MLPKPHSLNILCRKQIQKNINSYEPRESTEMSIVQKLSVAVDFFFLQ